MREYDKDLQFVWVGLDKESEDARVTRITQKVQSLITIDEARAELGLKPLPKELPTKPGDFIGSYDQALQILQGQQQQEEQQPGAGGYDDGDFGGQEDDDQGQQQQGFPGSQRSQKTPPMPQGNPQQGGPQHTDEEMQGAEKVQKSRAASKFLRFRIVESEDA